MLLPHATVAAHVATNTSRGEQDAAAAGGRSPGAPTQLHAIRAPRSCPSPPSSLGPRKAANVRGCRFAG
eukprot:5202669-Prymnesium_polylepis.1